MKEKKEVQIDSSWQDTYGDMVTLLLCFFVMMLAASSVDQAKYEQIQAGMQEGVGKADVQRPIEMMMVELADDIQSLDASDKVSLGSDTQGVVLEFSGDTFFDTGSAEIKPQAIPILKKVAATLQSDRYLKFDFSIEGHTSNKTFSNSKYASNWELSAARAASVANFLQDRGIAHSRIKIVGFADNVPKLPNLDPFNEPIPQNQLKNQRVVIHIEPRIY